MLRVSSDCSSETHAEKKSFDVKRKNKKTRETLSLGYRVPKSPGKGGEGGLRDRTRFKRKRKERERKAQLAHPLNRPRGHGCPGAVFGEIHPSVSISFIQRCDWLVACLAPAPTSYLHGVYFPKVHGPHLVDQPLLPEPRVSAQRKICKPMRAVVYRYWLVWVSLTRHPAFVFTIDLSIGETSCPSRLWIP